MPPIHPSPVTTPEQLLQTRTARRGEGGCEADNDEGRTALVLILPGWQNSGADHWQTQWEMRYGDQRVDQHDWLTPRRGDWMAQLETTLLARPRGAPPVYLVAHSLGCHLVAAWGAHSAHTALVAGALLVAPPDPYQDDFPPGLSNWRVPVLAPLPFGSVLVHASNDPFGGVASAQALAAAWGSRCASIGARGHINANSGLGEWPEGRTLLASLAQPRPTPIPIPIPPHTAPPPRHPTSPQR